MQSGFMSKIIKNDSFLGIIILLVDFLVWIVIAQAGETTNGNWCLEYVGIHFWHLKPLEIPRILGMSLGGQIYMSLDF